ncbi:MAG: L-arabinose isomerase family protein [Candidatus Humimicrobiaceae bacterium]
MKQKIKAAFIGFGEINTPKEVIEKKCFNAKKLLENNDLELINYNIVNDDAAQKTSEKAIKSIINKTFDILIICIAGWIPTWAVIKVAKEFEHKPMLLWGLTGYYENNKLLTTADQAGTSALRKVFEDMDFNFKYIYDSPEKPADIKVIKDFAKACQSGNTLNSLKIGMMGYRDMNLYGTMYDGTSIKSKLGVEIEHFEMLEIVQKINTVSHPEVEKKIKEIRKKWDFQKPAADSTLKAGVEFYLALKEKILERRYDAISLNDVDGMKKLLNLPPAMIFMLVSDEMGICTIPENDSLGSVTQLICRCLTGQISAYMEFYEFMEDRILMGVPDFIPFEITDGKTKVVPTKFGDLNEGILNISKVKTGKVTLARLANSKSKYLMHIMTGKAIIPGSWEEVGWTQPAPQLPSLEIILDSSVDDFAQKVMSQHYIITYGDNSSLLKDFCKLKYIDVI